MAEESRRMVLKAPARFESFWPIKTSMAIVESDTEREGGPMLVTKRGGRGEREKEREKREREAVTVPMAGRREKRRRLREGESV